MFNITCARRRLWAGLLSIGLFGCATIGQRIPSGATVMAVTLPSPRHEAAVFSDGQMVYVAGGLDDKSTVLAQIVRYYPAAGTLAVMADVPPTATYAAGVAWTGSAAYLFGGLGCTTVLSQSVRYVPGRGTTIMTAKMPMAAYNVAAVWTGSRIYVFGGQKGGSLTQILAYDRLTFHSGLYVGGRG